MRSLRGEPPDRLSALRFATERGKFSFPVDGRFGVDRNWCDKHGLRLANSLPDVPNGRRATMAGYLSVAVPPRMSYAEGSPTLSLTSFPFYRRTG